MEAVFRMLGHVSRKNRAEPRSVRVAFFPLTTLPFRGHSCQYVDPVEIILQLMNVFMYKNSHFRYVCALFEGNYQKSKICNKI